jgi:hypothetical protein
MVQFLLKYYKSYNQILYHLIMLIGIVIGLMRFKRLSASSRVLLLLLFITPVVELLAFYCAVHYRNNSMVYNPFTIVQFALIGLAFFSEKKQSVYLTSLFLCILLAVFNGIYFQPFFLTLNTNSILLTSLFIIIWYFTFLVSYFKNADGYSLKQLPLFWVGGGWMFFSVVSIISFGFMKLYAKGGMWDDISTYTRQFSNYLLYLSFIPAFLSPQKSLNDITAGK